MKFIRFFLDLDGKCKTRKFNRYPFQCDVTYVTDQEEFPQLKFSSSAEDDFKTLNPVMFLDKYLSVYPHDFASSLRILTIFRSAYLCKAAFSELATIMTQYWNN